MNSFVRFVKENGGKVYDIIYDRKLLKGDFCSCNTTCAWINDGLTINSRLVNYQKLYQSDNLSFLRGHKIAQTYVFNENGYESRNVMSRVKDSHITDIHEIKYPDGCCQYSQYRGLEDCRLIVWDNKLYAYGTRWDKIADNGCMCIYEIGDNGIPVDEIIVQPQGQMKCEKNWMAVDGNPFTFIYSNNPTTVIKVNKDGSCEFVGSGSGNDNVKDFIKGSSQVIRYSDNEYIALVHTNISHTEGETQYSDYVTAFVFYDNSFNITRMSKWFVFNSQMCEFVCGLSIHNETVYITYSQLDCTSHLIITDKKTIEEFIKKPDNSVDGDMFYDYYNMAKKYENYGQIKSSLVLFNHAIQLAYQSKLPVSDELKIECLIKIYCGLVDFAPNILNKSIYLDFIDSLHELIKQYPNVCEFYYLLSSLYKMTQNGIDEYLVNKKLGDERKTNMHNYFLRYFNPNYL